MIHKGPASYPRAVELFKAASDAGHAVATALLATAWSGEGVEESEADGERLARVALDEQGLQSLAEQGDASAQQLMGDMCCNGIGVAENDCKAVAWWRKSAAQGYAEAQCDLGYAYRDGVGVEKNVNEAVVWFRKAAEQGYADAQCSLGEAYRGGRGVD